MREQPQLLVVFGDDDEFGDRSKVGAADEFVAIVVVVDVVVEVVVVDVADVVLVEFVASNCRFWLWCLLSSLLFSFFVNEESNGESRTSSS